MDYWHYAYSCPYFTSSAKDNICCEGGCRVRFPDRKAAVEYMKTYCASDHGWQQCSIAKNRNEYYDRKYIEECDKRALMRLQSNADMITA